MVAFLLRAICNFTFGKEQTFCPFSGAGLGNESALDDLRNKSAIMPNPLPWFKFLSIGSKRCSYFDGILRISQSMAPLTFREVYSTKEK